MSLYIGAYYPDRQLDESLFANSLVKIAANIAKQRHHAIQKSPPYLDIKFLISGKQEAPDFEGMRLYAYDEKSSTLRIESAVPERMMNSTHSEDYIVAVLQDAVDNAADSFAAEDVTFKREAYQQFIDTISETSI